MTGAIAGNMKEKKKMHPYKFNMWLAIAGIIMFFAAFTSAYIVMHDRDSWQSFKMPSIFLVSTFLILVSSLTMHFALKKFKQHRMLAYRYLITLTAALGFLFLVSQLYGFSIMYDTGLTLTWNNSTSFLYVIVMAHMAHVLGGVIALMFIFFRAYRRKVRTYDAVPVEIVSTYWHFVDVLWIYLYIFFLIIG